MICRPIAFNIAPWSPFISKLELSKGHIFIKKCFYSKFSPINFSESFAASGIFYRRFSTEIKGKENVLKQAEWSRHAESIEKCTSEPKLKNPVSNNDLNGSKACNSNLGKPYKPVVPILFYKATKRATDSINHRLFYINALFLIFLYDVATAFIDF